MGWRVDADAAVPAVHENMAEQIEDQADDPETTPAKKDKGAVLREELQADKTVDFIATTD
jgi:hypothetical protein